MLLAFEEPSPRLVEVSKKDFCPTAISRPPTQPLVSLPERSPSEDYLLRIRDVAGIGQDKGAEFVEILHSPSSLVTGGVLL